jgi:hypothetical protein
METDKALDALTAGLRCGVCKDFVRPPAVACDAAQHGFCRACLCRCPGFAGVTEPAGEVRPCPLCQTPRKFVPCPMLDRIVADHPATCTFGCGAAGLTVATVAAHEDGCAERPVACKFREHGCTWTGRAQEAPAHESGCPLWAAEFRERTERHYRSECEKVRRTLVDRVGMAMGALRAVVPHSIMTLPAVTLAIDGAAGRAEFATASGRRFELRADALERDPGLAPLRQTYGCVIVHVPSAEVMMVTGDTPGQRGCYGFMARMTVILLDPATRAIVGVGSMADSFPGDRTAARPVVFAGPVVDPPPWSAYVAVDPLLPRTDRILLP